MAKYILRDLAGVLRYLPYGVGAGIVAFVCLLLANKRREQKGKSMLSVPAGTLFFMYIVILLFITFLSRESGSRVGVDLELFSTLGINRRNNAFVIENIMLFVPYGFLGACALAASRNLFSCILLGMFTSIEIEYMQLVTGRGYFQVDDIITNTLGAVVGYLLFRLIFARSVRVKNEGKADWKSQIFQIPAILLLIAIMLYLIAVTGICPADVAGFLMPSDNFAWCGVRFFPVGTLGLGICR